jgi:tetratricopeptide (TPR) repeat protein
LEQNTAPIGELAEINMTLKIFSVVAVVTLLFSCKEDTDMLLQKARSFSDKEKYKEAIELYNKAIGQNSKMQSAFLERGYCYLKTKDYQRAYFSFNRIFELQRRGSFMIKYNSDAPFAPEEAKYQVDRLAVVYYMAQTKYKMDSVRSSFIDFQTCIDNSFKVADCLLWQGSIWVNVGKPEKACVLFRKAKLMGEKEADEMIAEYCNRL